MKKVIIIGAGASGVYLSLLLMKKMMGEIEVVVLEQNSSSLKKLLATGNGRCNLSNKDMSIQYYQSDRLDIVDDIISHFDLKKEFEDIGLMSLYYGQLLYPRSEQALTVKNVLMNEAINHGVHFMYDKEVLSIDYTSHYIIHTKDTRYKADYVVLAMGSEAGKLSGMSMSRYEILKQLGLKVITPTPSLVSMNTSPSLKQLKGVRIKGTFSLLENNQCIHKEKGELLFTEYGISGIAVMQLSSYIKENHHYEISIDMFDEYSKQEVESFVKQRKDKEYDHFYDGFLNNKLAHYFESLNKNDILSIVKLLKDFRLKIISLRSVEFAQVMKGGLSLDEIHNDLSLKKYPHMYAVGEILNVAGMCGGYNLHFAFASSYKVANAIEREINVKNK